jgi:hypothetical protein
MKPVTVMVYLCSYIHTALESRTLGNCHCICSWKTTLEQNTKTSQPLILANIRKEEKKFTHLFFHDSEHSFAKAIKLGLAEKVLTS